MKQLLYLLIGLFIIGLSACKSLPAPSINSATSIKDSTVINIRDSVRIIEKVQTKDSVVTRDSVVQVVDENGNVIKSEYYKLKEIYKDTQSELAQLQAKYDELSKSSNKQDSTAIREPYPVEKELSLWQKIKIGMGEVSLIIIVILLLIMYIKRK